MSNNTVGTVVEFTAAAEFEDGETIVMTPAKPSRTEAILIGWNYYEAATEADQDAILEEFGPTLVGRGLRAFANYAARTGQKEVAGYAKELRSEFRAYSKAV